MNYIRLNKFVVIFSGNQEIRVFTQIIGKVKHHITFNSITWCGSQIVSGTCYHGKNNYGVHLTGHQEDRIRRPTKLHPDLLSLDLILRLSGPKFRAETEKDYRNLNKDGTFFKRSDRIPTPSLLDSVDGRHSEDTSKSHPPENIGWVPGVSSKDIYTMERGWGTLL